MSEHKRPTKLQRRFKAAIKAKGYRSQNALAREVGIGTGHLSMILRGERCPRWTLATTLGEATGIEATAFLQGRA